METRPYSLRSNDNSPRRGADSKYRLELYKSSLYLYNSRLKLYNSRLYLYNSSLEIESGMGIGEPARLAALSLCGKRDCCTSPALPQALPEGGRLCTDRPKCRNGGRCAPSPHQKKPSLPSFHGGAFRTPFPHLLHFSQISPKSPPTFAGKTGCPSAVRAGSTAFGLHDNCRKSFKIV